jgi:pimeloyl-ACP methyl ester carboxylesterase
MPSHLPYFTAINFEVNRKRVRKDDLVPYFDHLSKMQARVFAQLANNFSAHNAEHVLPSIEHPTLIVAGGRDTFSPPWLSLDMHEAIQGSELLFVPDGSHVTPIEHPELINLRLHKFVKDHTHKPKRASRSRFSMENRVQLARFSNEC